LTLLQATQPGDKCCTPACLHNNNAHVQDNCTRNFNIWLVCMILKVSIP